MLAELDSPLARHHLRGTADDAAVEVVPMAVAVLGAHEGVQAAGAARGLRDQVAPGERVGGGAAAAPGGRAGSAPAEELRGRLARGFVLPRCQVHFAEQPLEARHYLEELAEGAEGEAVVLAFVGPDVYV